MKRVPAALTACSLLAVVACSGGGTTPVAGRVDSQRLLPSATSGRTSEVAHFAQYQATDLGEAAPNQPVHFTVTLAHRDETGLQALIQRQGTRGSSDYERFLTPATFNERFGASAATRAAVIASLAKAGFRVLPQRLGPGIIQVEGTSSQAELYFHTKIHAVRQFGVARYSAVSALTMPAAIQPSIVAVTGLDDLVIPHAMPVAGAETQLAAPGIVCGPQGCSTPSPRKSLPPLPTPTPMPTPAPLPTPPDVVGSDGPGPCRNVPDILPAEGSPGTDTAWYPGYAPCTYAEDFDMPNQHGFLGSKAYAIATLTWAYPNQSDLSAFFSTMGVTRTASINHIQITNYGTGGWASQSDNIWPEVTGDIEMIGALAADATIDSYESEDGTGGGIVNALNTIVQNNADAVVNMSFGFGEYAGPSTQFEYTQAFHNAISQGSAQGMTFVASTGDLGLNHCGPGDFYGGLICSPASDPLVVAVGGLSPFTQNNYGVAYEQSYAWSGTGGGTSQYFSKGPSQANVCGGSMRCIPDIALPADSVRFAYYVFRGSAERFSGTSFAANIFSAMQGEIDERQGTRKGSVNTSIYAAWTSYGYGNPGQPSQGLPIVFTDVTAGNNGAQAGPGWDFASGIGIPDGFGLSNFE